MRKSLFSCTSLIVALLSLPAVAAFNFQEPTDWAIGDAGSTYQNWTPSFANSDTPPTSHTVNPTISITPTLGVQTPGFSASSGGYYSFTGNYWISSNIYNHGGSGGSNPQYASGYSTRVIVQTSASTNPDTDISVLTNMIELVKLDGTPIAGGTNAELLGVTQLFLQEVETPFGLANQEELRFEFLLPAYSSDFRVRLQASMHSSFQQLRVDTLLVADQTAIPGDIDGDGDVDGDDLAVWQASYGVDTTGDADGDGDVDGRDFLVWQRNYTGPLPLTAFSVPEPTSLLVVIFGIITGLSFRVSSRVGSR